MRRIDGFHFKMMSNKLFVFVYLSSMTIVMTVVVGTIVKCLMELNDLKKDFRVEMIEFMYSSNEAWRLMKEVKRIRKRNSASNDLWSSSINYSDGSNDSAHYNEIPVGVIDEESEGARNGEPARRQLKNKKTLRKKAASDQCAKDCEEKNSKCPPGPPGPPGRKGKTGERGEDGVSGVPGMSGITVGTSGECIKCPQGPMGRPGIDGEMGKRGKSGTPGISVKAAVGAPGPQGGVGYPGYPGFPGPPGPAGDPGRDAYRFNNPPGEVGPPGPEGYRGPQGPKGNSYDLNVPGPPGTTGRGGRAGAPGLSGKTGKAGKPGRDGNYCPCPKPSKQRRQAMASHSDDISIPNILFV